MRIATQGQELFQKPASEGRQSLVLDEQGTNVPRSLGLKWEP
jgi:hypothetical protein